MQLKVDSVKNRRNIQFSVQAKMGKEQEKIFSDFDRFTKENPKLFYLILLPIYTLFTFMWFYKSRLNFSEHIILNVYKTCVDIIIGIVLTLGFYLYPKITFWSVVYPFATLIIIAYGTWFYYDFFKLYYRDKTIVFLKSLAVILSVQFAIGIAAVVYMIIRLVNSGLFK